MNTDASTSAEPEIQVGGLPPITHPDSQVRAVDRIAFTILLAFVIHFLAWAALEVNPPVPKERLSSPLHVTLSKAPAMPVNEPVKRIAEQDQQASGIGEQEQEPQTSVSSSPLQKKKTVDPVVAKVEAKPEAKKSPESKPEPLLKSKPASETRPKAKPEASEDPPLVTSLSDAQALLARSLEIARLEAEQQALAEQYAKRPRVRTISTLTAKASDDAFYLRQWQEKVERVGNLNYPERIRRENLTGRLRLLVALNPDGSVKEAQILKSSGQRVLDEAALEIVHLAAPFAPFPRSIRERTDILEIIRTWQFGNGNLFSESG
ncbi:TonB family protein [Oceanospirillum sp.]|uniref:TonB family protein n=1 Tax=Oceanospirillum sp. TaxID=2021254 RepID=UPI003A8CCC9E